MDGGSFRGAVAVACAFVKPEPFSPVSSLVNSSSKPRHECGVFAVYGHPNAALLTYYGLFALQHRGQESAGMVTTEGSHHLFNIHRGMGLVSQVFGEKDLQRLTGTRAIGHVRYSTTGSSTLKNAQPLVVDCARCQLAIAHNGNLVNAQELRTVKMPRSVPSWMSGRQVTAVLFSYGS